MKTRELTVSCYYAQEGPSAEEIVQSSFAVFLKREAERISPGYTAAGACRDVRPPIGGNQQCTPR